MVYWNVFASIILLELLFRRHSRVGSTYVSLYRTLATYYVLCTKSDPPSEAAAEDSEDRSAGKSVGSPPPITEPQGKGVTMGNSSPGPADKLWLTLRKPTARNSYTLPASRVQAVFVVGSETKVRRTVLRRLQRGRKCSLISVRSLPGFRSSLSGDGLAALLRQAIAQAATQGVCFM